MGKVVLWGEKTMGEGARKSQSDLKLKTQEFNTRSKAIRSLSVNTPDLVEFVFIVSSSASPVCYWFYTPSS